MSSHTQGKEHSAFPALNSVSERIPTGVTGLDQLSYGGLPRSSLSLVMGPPGSGKSTFARQFLQKAASANRPVVLASTADSRELINASMLGFGWNPEDIESVEVMDMYSWRQAISPSLDLKNVTEVSIAMANMLEKFNATRRPCLVIDSFSDFLLYGDTNAAVRFLGQLKGRLQAKMVTTLILLEQGLHPAQVELAMEYVTDATIRMRFDETGRYVMISRMMATPVELRWSKFTIEKGIEVVVKNFLGGNGK